MPRQSVAPLLIGTFIQRTSSGAGTIVLGLLLVSLSSRSGHHINSLQVGLLPVAYYVTELSLAPFMGSLSDRWGRHIFLIVGPLIGFVHAALLFYTPNTHPLSYLVVMEILAGLSGAMLTPAVLGYLADITAKDSSRRMRVMSLYELVTSGGIAVGVAAAGVVWAHFGRAAFLLLAACYLLVALCMALAPRVHQTLEQVNVRYLMKRYWRLLQNRRLFIFIPAWLCISTLLGVWFSSQITFILSNPQYDPQQIVMGSMAGPGGSRTLSLILGGFVMCFGLCLLFWAFFLNRVPRLPLMLGSIAGIYLICIALFGINHRGAGNDIVLFFWFPVLLVGIFAETGFAPAALAYLADLSESAARDRGIVMGLYSLLLGVGQILGNSLGGLFAHSFGFDGLIYFTALLACIALVSLLWLFQQEKKPVKGEQYQDING